MRFSSMSAISPERAIQNKSLREIADIKNPMSAPPAQLYEGSKIFQLPQDKIQQPKEAEACQPA